MCAERYLLRPHVYWCSAQGYWVFLDLVADKYLAMRPPPGLSLERLLLVHSPTGAGQVSASDEDTTEARLIQSLQKGQLVTTNATEGKAAAELEVEAISRAALCARGAPRKGRRAARAIRTASSVLRASYRLKRHSLHTVVRDLRASKAQLTGRHSPTGEQLEAMVADFQAWQPYFGARKNACLRHSLALMYFLAGAGVCAEWIFGVRANPFAAHCWVQAGPLLLNDSVDHVRNYSPIMVV
jgi:hypothetical protein